MVWCTKTLQDNENNLIFQLWKLSKVSCNEVTRPFHIFLGFWVLWYKYHTINVWTVYNLKAISQK